MSNEEKQIVKYDPQKPVRLGGGLPGFRTLMEARKGSIQGLAASFMSPERIIKIVLNNFTKNPALFDCTMESVWRAGSEKK